MLRVDVDGVRDGDNRAAVAARLGVDGRRSFGGPMRRMPGIVGEIAAEQRRTAGRFIHLINVTEKSWQGSTRQNAAHRNK